MPPGYARPGYLPFLLLLVFPILLLSDTAAQERRRPRAGVHRNTINASPGYTLVHPIYKNETFLVDLDGNPVHSWPSDYAAASAAYLLDDGSLLRATMLVPPGEDVRGRGAAGRIERVSWDGELLWEYQIAGENELSHHDFEPLPNGNVLVTVWERRSPEEAIEAGRDPETIEESGVYSETIHELQPVGRNDARVVWKWDVWDHLIQDFDPKKSNFGDPAEHPGRVDVNITGRNGGPLGDWLHLNSVDYNPRLDQILLSTPVAHELWIIDHSTTTEEAATSSGGRTGRGGDLLYRWGNPQVWLGEGAAEQRLFFQHDPHWIPDGLPGGGHILIFNNGIKGGGRAFSTVDEIVPPLMSDGTYSRAEGAPFPPLTLAWRYGGPNARFFANRISGAQRLPNGNTLICIGSLARLVEVNPEGLICWDFFNGSNAGLPLELEAPFRSALPFEQGGPLGGGGPMFRGHRYSPDHPGLARLSASGAPAEHPR